MPEKRSLSAAATARTVWETAADLVLPRHCPGCGGVGPWCGGCAATLGRPREPVLPEATVDSWQGSRLPAFRALARYRGPVRSAIIAGKEYGRRDLPPLLGRALGAGLTRLRAVSVVPDGACLVPAPSRRSAARARGGDPVAAMARAAAEHSARTGVATAVAPCLTTVGRVRDSVGLTPEMRALNLLGRIRFDAKAGPEPGAPVLLIDDVLTSGATALAACNALAENGFEVVAVLVVAAVPPWRSTM